MKNKIFIITFLMFLALMPFSVYASENVINKDSKGIALKGYDPVAYFVQGKAVAGKKEFEHKWMEATWQFSSAENRDLFAANPEKYAPQFGGYCAYGVTGGYLAPVDPKAWKIVDNKLYLNYDFQVQKKWQEDIPGYLEKANKKWPEASKTKPLQ